MNIFGYIYKIINIKNFDHYVGKAGDISDRMREHRKMRKDNLRLSNALRKYGLENFEYAIIDIAYSEEDLNEKEIFWIKHYGKIYNLTDGGEGVMPKGATKENNLIALKISNSKKGIKKGPMSIEQRQKISESNKIKLSDPEIRKKISLAGKGRVISPEQRKKLSESNKGKHNFVMSEETKAKISKSLIGRPCKEETKKILSQQKKGRVYSEEHKKNISQAKKIMFDSWTLEEKRKLTEVARESIKTPEYREKMSKIKKGVPQSKSHIENRIKANKRFYFKKKYPELFSFNKEIPPVLSINYCTNKSEVNNID